MNNKKPYVKLALDVVMGITFALLYNKMVLGGLAFHEIAGIAIAFAFAAHILLNLRFVQKITLRLFDKTLPGKTRFSYFLNVLLLIFMSFVIVSGLLISKVVLPNFRYGNEGWFKISHMGVSYLTLILIGIHIGLHWHWVMKVTQRLLHLKMSKSLARILLVGAAVLVLGFGGYQMYTTNYLSKLNMLQTVVNPSAMTGGAGGAGRPAGGMGEAGRGRPEGMKEGMRPGGGAASPNPLSVLATYFGIMAVFAGGTYYVDKSLARRKSQRKLVLNV
jgi:hypothetical protein